jgi:hypothetical protein
VTVDVHTAQLLEQLRVAVHADRRRRRRRRLGATLAVALMAVSGGAWAAATQAPWWQSGSTPVDPQAVASVARDNMPADVDAPRARTVAQDGSGALVAVPLGQTGYCLVPTLDRRGDLGASCVYQVHDARSGAEDLLASYAQPAGRRGGPAWLVYGRVTDPRAASLDLGAFTVPLEPGGFFLAEIARDRWPGLDGRANEGRILDSSGATLRSGCVNWGPSPASGDADRSDTLLWLDGNGPCRPQPLPVPATVDYTRAQQLFRVTLERDYSIWKAGTTIAFWRAPASDGTQCVFPATIDLPDSGLRTNPPGAADCRNPAASWPSADPLSVNLGAQHVHVDGRGGYAYTTSGRVDPAARIERLELRAPSGRTPAALAGGYFFVEIPGTSASAGTLPGRFTLVGLDSAGREVVRVSMNELQDKARPR